MKTIVFEVVLGLVFIYLIYSIFITIIAEMLATWLGVRARLLRQGITHLLTDVEEKETNGLYGIWRRFMLMSPKGYKNTIACQFYEQPSIKYLSQTIKKKEDVKFYQIWNWFGKNSPSYISKENFSATLINMLRKEGRGIHDWGKIGFSINNNALHMDSGTSKQFKAMYDDADDDMDVFTQLLERWYEEMMDRVNGWFKRKIQFLIFWVSFIIVMIINADTFMIVKTLSKDNTTRDQFVQMAVAAAEENSKISSMISQVDTNFMEDELYKRFHEINKEVDKSALLLGQGWRIPEVDLEVDLDTFQKKILENIDSSYWPKYKRANDLSKTWHRKLGAPKLNFIQIDTMYELYHQYQSEAKSHLAQINSLVNTKFITVKSFDKNKRTIKGTVPPCLLRQAGHVISRSHPFNKKFWGFSLTALAICLGAPFWFDLLKKLVALRGAGINPLEKKKEEKKIIKRPAEKSQLGKTIKGADAVDIAIAENRSKWEAIPGVIAINKVLSEKGSGRFNYMIEVSHLERSGVALIPKKVKLKDTDMRVRVVKKLRQKGEFNVNNERGILGGTIAGLLNNTNTKRQCVLTCAHVLSPNGHSIVYEGGDPVDSIGNVSSLIWSNILDAGVVDLAVQNDDEFKKYKRIDKTYDVTFEDEIKETKVYVLTKNKDRGKVDDNTGDDLEGTFKNNIRITHVDFDFDFTDIRNGNTYRMYDLIAISKRKGDINKPVTQSGDSGALVCTLEGDVPIGIVIGSSKDANDAGLSFVLPINKILDTLNLKFYEKTEPIPNNNETTHNNTTTPQNDQNQPVD